MSPADIRTDRDALLEWLTHGEVVVRFTKADGTERTMHCTQKDIPEVDRYWGKRNQIVQVKEIIPDGPWEWRAFNRERVIDWYIAS